MNAAEEMEACLVLPLASLFLLFLKRSLQLPVQLLLSLLLLLPQLLLFQLQQSWKGGGLFLLIRVPGC